MAANIFTGATNANWGTSTNWSLAAVPTAADGNPATFNITSPNCTVDTSARVCNSIDFTGYTNTITMTNQITSSGSVTLASGMTIAGASGLIVNAASTLTANTKVWPNALTLQGAVTHTLADNWNVDGLLSLGNATNTTTINGNQITASAGLTLTVGAGIVAGTTNIILDGTGTITGSTSTGVLRNNLTINTAGTITIATADPFRYNTGTLTDAAGTVVTTGSTLTLAAATTLAVAGITWNHVTFQGSVTHTLNENMTLTGTLTLGATTAATVINGNTIHAMSNVTLGVTTGSVTGTTIISIEGTSTFSDSGMTTGKIDNPITLSAGAGTITISASIRCLLEQLKYVSGTIITVAGTWASASSAGGPLIGPGRLVRG